MSQKASIIILNWKGSFEDCDEAIKSAIDQDYQNKEILFVDNGSHDSTCELLRKKYSNVLFVELPDNLGVTGGRNIGAKAASGDVLFFLENDGAWASNDVVSSGVKLLEKYDKVGVIYTAVQGYQSGINDPTCDDHIDFSDELLSSSSFRGGAAIIRAHIFNEIGGYADDFFRQAEEKCFSLFVYEMGYCIAYASNLVMKHKGSDYQGKKNLVSWFNCINDLKTIIRHYPAPSAYTIVFFKYLVWVLRFLLNKRFGEIIKMTKIVFAEFRTRGLWKKLSLNTVAFNEYKNFGLIKDFSVENFSINNYKIEKFHPVLIRIGLFPKINFNGLS